MFTTNHMPICPNATSTGFLNNSRDNDSNTNPAQQILLKLWIFFLLIGLCSSIWVTDHWEKPVSGYNQFSSKPWSWRAGWEGKYEVAKSRDTWEKPTSCWVRNTSQIHANSPKNYVKRFASVSSTARYRDWSLYSKSFDAATQAPLLKSCWAGSEAEVAGKPWAVPTSPQMQCHSPRLCQASPGLSAVTAHFRSNSNCQEVDCILFCWEGQTKLDPQHTLKSISK